MNILERVAARRAAEALRPPVKYIAPPQPRCEDCGLFISRRCDRTEYDEGCDAEYEFGTCGPVIRTPWREEIDITVCRSCGYENRKDVTE